MQFYDMQEMFRATWDEKLREQRRLHLEMAARRSVEPRPGFFRRLAARRPAQVAPVGGAIKPATGTR